MSCRILFGGMSTAGKSTLACSVYEVLKERGIDASIHELDIWSDTHACILGKKPWDERDKRGGPSGDPLHPEFAAAVEKFRADDAAVVIGDLPGRRNPSWDAGIGCADYAVLVSRRALEKDGEDFFADHEVDWEQQMREWAIPVIARVESLRSGQPHVIAIGHFIATDLDRVPLLDDPGIRSLSMLIARFAEVPHLQTV